VALTTDDELVLVGVSLAADRRRLERVARSMLDRDDAVTDLLRAAAATEDGGEAWGAMVAVLERCGAGDVLNLLDLVVEVGQQERERRGESRTWSWPAGRGGNEAPSAADRKRRGSEFGQGGAARLLTAARRPTE
jgi:hypothetical protein